MLKVSVVTATRAEYGILKPLIKKLDWDNDIELQLIATGTHLSQKYGFTVSEICDDNFKIFKRIPILEDGNSPYDISLTMANALKGFAEYFRDNQPDLVILLGDRTEMLAIASAAMNERVPICHIHGGEVTEGAVDECVRHAITKMSYMHFASTENYKNRIIQLGEQPENVYNSGALSVENILNTNLLSKDDLLSELDIPSGAEYAVVTFHPVTLEENSHEWQIESLYKAMRSFKNMYYIVTKSNADAGGELINQKIEGYSKKDSHIRVVSSLGMKKYLSAVKHAEFVLGNSSSGVIEAPTIGTPTVNVGDRQRGRLMPETVISCSNEAEDIIEAINNALQMEHKPSGLYGDGNTSEIIVSAIKEKFKNPIKLKKKFYDINQGESS